MRVLIAEDEMDIARAIKVFLEKNKFSVDMAGDGISAWDYLRQISYDVVVLDIMMPGRSGLEVLKDIRREKMTVPVLLLTAKSEVEDRVAGLEAGADDYLPKPFAASELVARVRALSRRNTNYTEEILTVGDLSLNRGSYELSAGGASIRLNNKEYQMMELFMSHPKFIFSTNHLMERIWGQDTETEIDVVWTYVGFLRKKLKQLGARTEIRTVRGAGYTLEELC